MIKDVARESKKAKSSPTFIVRLVGHGISPDVVPMRSLTRVLDAVQRLVEQRDDGEIEDTKNDQELKSPVLHLVRVTSSSAAYAVAAPEPDGAVNALALVGRSLSAPSTAEWKDSTLSSLQDFSEVAKTLQCQIEFRRPSCGRTPGDVIVKITPSTFSEVEGTAYIHGRTSVYARIERVGGATDMHCGIRLPRSPRKMVICRVISEELIRALGQHMYKHVILSGPATWLRYGGRLRKLTIESFEPPKTGSILEALRKAHDAGGYAWDVITDPVSFISGLRN